MQPHIFVIGPRACMHGYEITVTRTFLSCVCFVRVFVCVCAPVSLFLSPFLYFFLPRILLSLSLSRYHLSFLCRKSLPRLYVFLSFSRRQSRSFSTIAHTISMGIAHHARARIRRRKFFPSFSFGIAWRWCVTLQLRALTHCNRWRIEGKTYPHVCVEVCSRLEGALLCFTRLGKRVGRISLIR